MQQTSKRIVDIIYGLFSVRNFLWLAVASVLTYLLVFTGFDAQYFDYLQNTVVYRFFSLAGLVGFVGPVAIFAALWISGKIKNNKRMLVSSVLFFQASFLGWLTSSMLKFFTGRIPPPYGGDLSQFTLSNITELSYGFRFGFGQGGIFWGWPSSHTAVAFAGAVALAVYYREKSWVRYVLLSYASYIAIGASTSFHWLSDVVAGVIVGSIIGVAVANSFIKPVTSGRNIDAKRI